MLECIERVRLAAELRQATDELKRILQFQERAASSEDVRGVEDFEDALNAARERHKAVLKAFNKHVAEHKCLKSSTSRGTL